MTKFIKQQIQSLEEDISRTEFLLKEDKSKLKMLKKDLKEGR